MALVPRTARKTVSGFVAGFVGAVLILTISSSIAKKSPICNPRLPTSVSLISFVTASATALDSVVVIPAYVGGQNFSN